MEERWRQIDFLKLCPENSRFAFTRTLRDVFFRDFLPTIELIRELYIPRFDPQELTDFPKAFAWARDNSEAFYLAGFRGGVPFSSLPKYVFSHQATLGILFEFATVTLELSSERSATKVAYLPDSARWEKDVGDCTKPAFEKIKNHPTEEKPFQRDYDSTTRSIALIQQAFSSD